MNLKRYEEAADSLSKAIDKAPATKQAGLRDLRKQCVMAEVGVVAPASGVNQSPAPAPAQTTTQAEVVLWKSIENSQRASDFEGYLQQYPAGAFATLAKGRLDEIHAEATRQQEQQKAQLASAQTQQTRATQAAWQQGESFHVSHWGGMGWGGNGTLVVNPSGVTYYTGQKSSKNAFSASCSDLKWSRGRNDSVDFEVKSSGIRNRLAPIGDGNTNEGPLDDHLLSVLRRYCGDSTN
jgi:hypothetical protein